MIVPMKKVSIIVQSKDKTAAVFALRKIGILHIQHQNAPGGEEVSALQLDIALVNQALGIISQVGAKPAKNIKCPDNINDIKIIARHIDDLRKRQQRLEEYSRVITEAINQWQKWGDFDPQKISQLAEKNIYVKFYQLPQREIGNLPREYFVQNVYTIAGISNCVVISDKKQGIAYKEIALPKMGLVEMRKRLKTDADAIEAIRRDIEKAACHYDALRQAGLILNRELEFHQAVKGMGQSGNLSFITGFAPADAVKTLFDYAKKEKWAVTAGEPGEDEPAPTLLRNPRWVSVISPVFKLIEAFPGYHELDISLWFLIFFSVFFGILIGDIGYGLVYLILTATVESKFGSKITDRSVFYLFYILSICAIIWGFLTGSLFGQGWIGGFLKPLMPALRNDINMQSFCFFLGALHLSIAHIWRAILKFPHQSFLADIGWTSILWGGFFMARFLVLGFTLPDFCKWLFLSGAVLVVFFTNPGKNILKSAGQGLGNLLLNIVNSFTDIVSYIRLFAVGLASVAVADSFNNMAMGFGFGGVFAGVAASSALILGHALNIALGPMSVLVHGVRLNMLEFCNHVDIKWSGVEYKPFR